MAAILIGQRFYHFGELLDEPHSWRQCDTANFAWAFYEKGIDLLRPSVCWMGSHSTLVFELPVPEAITAVLYAVLGPRHIYARLTTLLFFLGATYYLSAIVARLSTRRLGVLTGLIYLALPLGLFYSRAVHMDFCAVFFAHAMTYYFVRGYDERKVGWWLVASVAAALAFAVKAPYVFYLALPCAYHILKRPDLAFLKRGAVLWVLPALSFVLWRGYAARVNAAAPDWFFIPGYVKFVDADLGWYYYGSLSSRLDPAHWFRLGYRMLYYVASPIGCVASVLGLFGSRRSPQLRAFFLWWLLGVVIYLLIFFHLNIEHDYYSIPFLAVIAVFAARFLDSLLDALRPRFRNLAWLPVAVILLALAGSCVWLAETTYYLVDWIRVRAGEIIEKETPHGSLIITASPQSNPIDPRLLYLSRRNGWSIDISRLTPDLIESLRNEGAQYVAALYPDGPRPAQLRSVLDAPDVRSVALRHRGPRALPRRTVRWRLALVPLAPVRQ